ncbi:hypothetical protein KKG37_03235 [Patescibacteria group bacterium]|nr:hypothetical protein [Patescibacteria group bacterium]
MKKILFSVITLAVVIGAVAMTIQTVSAEIELNNEISNEATAEVSESNITIEKPTPSALHKKKLKKKAVKEAIKKPNTLKEKSVIKKANNVIKKKPIIRKEIKKETTKVKRAELKERREQITATVKAGLTDEQKEKLAQRREEFKQRITEKRKTRITAFEKKMTKRLQAAVNRLDKLADRIQSRLEKISDRVDITEATALISNIKEDIQDLHTWIGNLSSKLESVYASDDPKAIFEEVRAEVKEIVSEIKATHRALVEVVASLKTSIKEAAADDAATANE